MSGLPAKTDTDSNSLRLPRRRYDLQATQCYVSQVVNACGRVAEIRGCPDGGDSGRLASAGPPLGQVCPDAARDRLQFGRCIIKQTVEAGLGIEPSSASRRRSTGLQSVGSTSHLYRPLRNPADIQGNLQTLNVPDPQVRRWLASSIVVGGASKRSPGPWPRRAE